MMTIGALLFCFACAGTQEQGAGTGAGSQAGMTGGGTGTNEGALEESDINTEDFREIDAGSAELQAIFKDILFDYDDFSLKPGAKGVLKEIAEWLLSNTSRQILIEGHCDERGTNEYNLALGQRRANSAKKYLVQLGVASRRVSTLSYGEERPAAQGTTEEAYAQNRRDHFKIR